MTLFYIFIATFLNGLIAFVGAFSLFLKQKNLSKVLLLLVAFSAGALLSGAFLHLIPEALTELDADKTFTLALIGFSFFFLMEKFLHWHHCHEGKCEIHPGSYLLLFGDAIHNFIDGLVIAASFMVDVRFGIITTALIIAHELPQELGDFAILVHLGMKKNKALFYNFLSQMTAVVGGVLGFLLAGNVDFKMVMLPLAAGGFLYIAASDLIPELHKENVFGRSIASFLMFLLGIGFILAMKFFLDA